MSPTLIRTLNRGLLAVSFGVLAFVAACGGGGGGTAATAGTNVFTQGTVTGFGSVIVNGVRFDDSGVQAADDDDSAGELKLGMQVEVQSGAIDDNGGQRTARATHIRFGSEIKGPIEGAPDVAGNRMTVLGQTVLVSATTVFDVAGGLSALQAGNVVEVHAQYDATIDAYRATRIERESGATSYKLRGIVSALGADTFRIGGATINYKNLNPQIDAGALADGQRVRVRLATTQTTAGVWDAQRISRGERRIEDHAEAHLRGLVTSFTSAASFTVDGVEVDAGAASFPDGTAFGQGSFVEVEGTMSGGKLVATKVSLEDQHSGDDDHQTELHGLITSYDAGAGVLTLRGVTVRIDANTVFEGGTQGQLAVNAKVEVKGQLASDGVTVVATLVKFED